MCCLQIYFVSWDLTADAESGFSVKVQTMVIFTPVCKFAFLKLFAIAADYIRMQNWEAKKEVYIKMQKNKKQNCRIAANVCLYMYPLSLLLCFFFRYGKKLLFLKKVLPLDLLPVSGWPHYFHYLFLRPSSFLGCLHFFSRQNSFKVICKKKTNCKNKLPARN